MWDTEIQPAGVGSHARRDVHRGRMIGTLVNWLFGCHHKHLTRPITLLPRLGVQPTGTYVACLDCGSQFHYDLGIMRVGRQIPRHPPSSGGVHFQVSN